MRERSSRNMISSSGKRVKAAPSYGKTMAVIAGIALALILVLVNLFTFTFSVVQYYGDGMEPSLQNRQILLIRKTDDSGRIEEGDIIAFYYNNKALVRGVICTGGKTISMDQSGTVSIDGKPLEESYILSPSAGQCNISFPYSVPVGQYFVMGDNPLCLYHFPERGLYVYASTEEILKRALDMARMPLGKPTRVSLDCGEILRIDATGNEERSTFNDAHLLQRSLYWPYDWHGLELDTFPKKTHLDEIKSVAQAFGYAPEEIDRLVNLGFTADELEELLYCGEL